VTSFDDKKHSGSCIGKETNAVLDDFETDSVSIAKHKLNGLQLKVSHGAVVAGISESASGQDTERIHIPNKSPLKDFSKAIRELAERKNSGHSCADDLILAWESRISIGELNAMTQLLIAESKSIPSLAPLTDKFITVLENIYNRGEPIEFPKVHEFIARQNMPELVEFIESIEIARQAGIEVHVAAGNYRDETDRDSNRMALANVTLVGAVSVGSVTRVANFSRDGYGIDAETFQPGTFDTEVENNGVDLNRDGTTDISIEEIVSENIENIRIIQVTNPNGSKTLPEIFEGEIITGTSFSVPQNPGKEGLTFSTRTVRAVRTGTDSRSPELSGASTTNPGDTKKD